MFVPDFLSCFFQEANAGKSLFLLYALKRSPRLTLFYLYLFDYTETFLPFLHTCCPALTHAERSESIFLNTQVTLCRLLFSISDVILELHSVVLKWRLHLCYYVVYVLSEATIYLLMVFWLPLPIAAGAQPGTVDRVSHQVPAASVPADSRVCLGLAGRALLDLPLRYRQHRAVVRAGRLRAVEALGWSRNQVHMSTDWSRKHHCNSSKSTDQIQDLCLRFV